MIKSNFLINLFFSIALLVCSSLIPHLGFIVFIAFIPFFFGIKNIQKEEKGKFLKLLIYFVLFEFFVLLGSSFWLVSSSLQSFLIGVIFMTISFVIISLPSIYFFSVNSTGIVFWFFSFNWILHELLSQYLPIMTPFYLLGFSLGGIPEIIQNYSAIGVEGGTLWILITNISLFAIIENVKNLKIRSSYFLGIFISIVLLAFSLILRSNKELKGNRVEVAALHVKLDQTKEEFRVNPKQMIEYLWANSLKGISKKTKLLIWPETIITNFGWGHELNQSDLIDDIEKKIDKYPSLHLTFGANLYSLSTDSLNPKLNNDPINKLYYFTHNAAFSIGPGKTWKFRSKEIFIPFQEEIPFLSYFPQIRSYVSFVGNKDIYSEFNGGIDEHEINSQYSYYPVLCYEICYPIHISRNLNNNNFIVLLTNEFWNKNQIGSRQYLNCISAISIQNNTPIVKCSNGGISAIISRNGDVLEEYIGDAPKLLHRNIIVKESKTIYEYIEGYSYVLSFVLIIIFIFVQRFSKFQNKTKLDSF
jgi:apolipoprotein N-acyltransferase